MTIKNIASAVAKLEAKKSQVSIGNVREIIKHLKGILRGSPEARASFEKYLARK